MASGLPDYQREIRPRYGGARIKSGTWTLAASVENTLCNVSGKGMIYGGGLSTKVSTIQKFSVIKLYIDGSVFYEVSWDIMYSNQHIRAPGYPVFLLKCDPVNFVYSCGISPNITFETGFKFSYKEVHAGTPEFYWNLLYTLIT